MPKEGGGRTKKTKALTPVERMEDLALTSRVTETLEPHLGGLTDKTLTEFIIHLVETQLKAGGGTGAASSNAKADEELRQRLKDQGAPELPLNICQRLLEWVEEQSPRLKRWKSKQQKQQQQQMVGEKGEGDTTGNNPLVMSFPGLAKPNLNHSIELGSDFFDHGETSKRKVSNLPAWMDNNSNNNKRTKQQGLEPYAILQAKVEKSMDFGVIVRLPEDRQGVAYKSQLPTEAATQRNYFRSGQMVWCKILSITPQKIVVSIKDVDQRTGQDIMPHRNQVATELASRHSQVPLSSMTNDVIHPGLDVARLKQENSSLEPRATTKQPLSEQELYEAQQLIRSGVLPIEQYPTYDPNLGLLAVEETEEETEVELADVEPAFLRGQTQKTLRDKLEPIKIVKNPDGSLQRAALQQANMAKERRELRQAQANQLIDSIPKDLNRPWEDPLPEAGERHFAQELRSINLMSQHQEGAPEWKQKAESKTLSYGIISNKSIHEQRQSLPIYRLKKELMQAIASNQLLVVIGETGSGKVCEFSGGLVGTDTDTYPYSSSVIFLLFRPHK
jgi:ATP-dependent RNA helicase DHX8/PRP22